MNLKRRRWKSTEMSEGMHSGMCEMVSAAGHEVERDTAACSREGWMERIAERK